MGTTSERTDVYSRVQAKSCLIATLIVPPMNGDTNRIPAAVLSHTSE